MSKLKTAEEIANNYLYINVEATGEDMVNAIKEAQRNAIEVTELKFAQYKANLISELLTKRDMYQADNSTERKIKGAYVDAICIVKSNLP